MADDIYAGEPDYSNVKEILVVGNRPKPTSPGVFNLNSFMADIRARGIVRTHSFMVNIVPPKVLMNNWSDARPIIIRCDSASLPAVNFQTFETYKNGYGPQETSPHNVQFEPVNLSFILDSRAEVYSFWYQWAQAIMNFDRSKGINTPNGSGALPYEMSYRDDFTAEIKVLVYNEASDNIVQVSMLKAFPLGISDVPLNWASTDDFVRLNIPISYRDFYAQTVSASGPNGAVDYLTAALTGNVNKSFLEQQLTNVGRTILGRTTAKLDALLSDILMR